MQVRQATQADIPSIQEIADAAWWDLYPSFISCEQISYMLENMYSSASLQQQMRDGHQFLLAVDGKIICAFIAYTVKADEPSVLRIPKFYVHPGYQKKGVGKLLLSEVEERAKDIKAKMLELNVNRKNPAFGFYTHMGFAIVCEEDIPFGPFCLNDYVLRKAIK